MDIGYQYSKYGSNFSCYSLGQIGASALGGAAFGATLGFGAEALGLLGTADEAALTTLYRAVSPAEFESIMSSNSFSLLEGAMEAKQFGFTLEEVLAYANTDAQYAAIISAEVPTATLGELGTISNAIDSAIFKSGVLTVEGQTGIDLLNSAVSSILHAF